MKSRILILTFGVLAACSSQKEASELNKLEFKAGFQVVQDSIIQAEKLFLRLPPGGNRNFFISNFGSLIINNQSLGKIEGLKIASVFAKNKDLKVYSEKEVSRMLDLLKFLQENEVDGAYENAEINRFVFPFKEALAMQLDDESDKFARDIMVVHQASDTSGFNFTNTAEIVHSCNKLVLLKYKSSE